MDPNGVIPSVSDGPSDYSGGTVKLRAPVSMYVEDGFIFIHDDDKLRKVDLGASTIETVRDVNTKPTLRLLLLCRFISFRES